MEYKVTAYYNTGFNSENVPSSPAVLALATKKDFPDVWVLQNEGLAQVKLPGDWADIRDIDYVQIGDAFYTVGSIEQLNGVSVLHLVMDAINTAGGVSGFHVLDGWATRVHPVEDEPFSNLLPEPWSPKQELVLDGPVQMGPGPILRDEVPPEPGAPNPGKGYTTFVASTVQLSSIEKVAAVYKAGTGTEGACVTVPEIPTVKEATDCVLFSDASDVNPPASWGIPAGKVVSQPLPNTRLYPFENAHTREGMRAVRSLGLTETITACYNVPIYYQTPTQESDEEGGVAFDKVEVKLHKENPTELPYKFGSYVPKNKKVYSLYNDYTYLSIASSESMTIPARSLYSGGSEPDFYIFADPSPNGKPYCQPTYFDGVPALMFQNCIGGAQWMSTPIAFNRPDGYFHLMENARRTNQDEFIRTSRGVRDLELGMVSAGANAITGAASGSISTGVGMLSKSIDYGRSLWHLKDDYERNLKRREFDFKTAMSVVAPAIAFGRSAEIQGYTGNGFMLYRTRISEDDMRNLDRFLTMYGYTDSRALTDADFTSRKKFNFVEAHNVTVTGPKSMWVRNAISTQLSGGVRLWHELPNLAAMSDNPRKEAQP